MRFLKLPTFFNIKKNKRINSLLGFFTNKRQKFIFSVVILSLGIFISELILGSWGIILVFFVASLTSVLTYISLREDLKNNFSPQVLILPFFYSLAIGLFFLLVPARFITRIAITFLYAFGLYSLFLSQNIFTVSSIRTIALLSGARTVSLAITLLSYFFISNVVFSFHINVFITMILVALYTFPIIMQAFWTYKLEKGLLKNISWIIILTLCMVQIAFFLWFNPGSPTVIALFLTAMIYVLLELSHAWLEKRLFRSVILEYFWLAIISFIFLILFTSY